MLKRLSCTVLGMVIVAGLTPLRESAAQAQTFRREGRLQARAARQRGRADERAFGEAGNGGYSNGYYAPGAYYNGYGTKYAAPGYYNGAYYNSPYANGRYGNYYGAPGYYGGPGYNSGQGYGPGNYADGPSYGPRPAYAGPAAPPPRAYLGITMSETPEGVVRVSGVRPNSPADEAGLRRGDVILSLDGGQIYSAQDVSRMVARHNPGDSVRLDIDRNGQNDMLEAILSGPAGQMVGGPVPMGGAGGELVEPYYDRPARTPMQARRGRNSAIDPNLYNGFRAY